MSILDLIKLDANVPPTLSAAIKTTLSDAAFRAVFDARIGTAASLLEPGITRIVVKAVTVAKGANGEIYTWAGVKVGNALVISANIAPDQIDATLHGIGSSIAHEVGHKTDRINEFGLEASKAFFASATKQVSALQGQYSRNQIGIAVKYAFEELALKLEDNAMLPPGFNFEILGSLAKFSTWEEMERAIADGRFTAQNTADLQAAVATFIQYSLGVQVNGTWNEKLTMAELAGGNIGGALRALGSVVGGVLGAVVSVAHGIADAAHFVTRALYPVFEAIFGPGGHSPDPSDRTSWVDTDGHPHWGSTSELMRAKDAGTVASSSSAHDQAQPKSGTASQSLSQSTPILLDLDGTGIQITELSRSTVFVDAGGKGLQHRTAWAGAGDGVLFFDPDGRNAITEKRQYVFTEWDPTAKDDLAAIRSVFDQNGDGKLTSADADFAKFKVMVTNADGSTTVKTLAELGITEIALTADTTRTGWPDGSVAVAMRSVNSASGAAITDSHDDIGDGVTRGNGAKTGTGFSKATSADRDCRFPVRSAGRAGRRIGRQVFGGRRALAAVGGDGRCRRAGAQSGERRGESGWVGTHPTACYRHTRIVFRPQ